MKDCNIRGLYAFPEDHGYVLDAIVFGDLFEELVHRSIPLFIKPDWHRIYSLLSQFPKLTIVAVGHGPHGDDRFFRPLIERYKNFYIDTSTYLQDGGIEAFCNKYGAGRMLFGTGYPGNCIGGPILRILKADIEESQREMICHGNIKRILGEVKL
jgi:predicted TIM-barrel fold metal-dependent hydrolase